MLKDEEQQLAVLTCGLAAIGVGGGGWLVAVVGRRQVHRCQDSSHHCAP